MLAENVGRIVFTSDVVETNDLAGYSFAYTVEGKCRVTLVEFRVRCHRAIDNRLVVSKHVTLVANRNSEVTKSRT